MKFFNFSKQKMRDLFYPPQRFFRYIICGCGAAVINYLCFLLFNSLCKMHYVAAMLAATVITWIYSFFVNKFFVFEAKTGKTLRESTLFALQQIVLFGIASGLMWICVSLCKIPPSLAWLVVSGIILVFNFAGMKFLIWRKNQ